jgi:hypothetical protein
VPAAGKDKLILYGANQVRAVSRSAYGTEQSI